MKPAVVTLRKILTVRKDEKDMHLKGIYDMVLKLRDNEASPISFKKLTITERKDASDGVKRFIDKDFKKYLATIHHPITFNNYDLHEVTIDRNFSENTTIELELTSQSYTLLDSMGNHILLKEGDLRDLLNENEPTIDGTFFLELTPDISFNTYIPY